MKPLCVNLGHSMYNLLPVVLISHLKLEDTQTEVCFYGHYESW